MASPRTAPDLPVVDLPHLSERALLLLVADRKEHEPFTVEKALGGPPELRRALAVALGRSGHPAGLPVLRGLAADENGSVRQAAIFALGLARDPEAAALLLGRAADPERAEAALAVEALGKLGEPLVEVLRVLTPLPEGERWARLLPHLWRFSGDTVVPLALTGLGQEDRELRARAAFALASRAASAPRPEVVRALRALLADPGAPHPNLQTRGWAALALGSVGGEEDLSRLELLLADHEAGLVADALRAARALVLAGRAAAPASWRERLAGLFDDPRPAVRLVALEAAAAWLPDAALGERLRNRFASGRGREREVALVALAEGQDPQAAALAASAAAAPEPSLRRAAVEAAALLDLDALLATLARDPVPAVRAPALTARLGLSTGDPTDLLADGLGDDDPGVRAAVLTWLASHPVLPYEGISASIRLARRDPDPAARLAGVAALVARGKAQPLERGSVVRGLETLAAERDYLLRRAAISGLAALGRPGPPLGSVATGRGGDVYRDIVQRTSRPRSIEVRTARGTIQVRLACPEAPLTCLSFLQLMAQGFYDGLAFHRVEPGRFVETGDPRSRDGFDDGLGDGWGGPGYTLRDELNSLPARRGALAMSAAEPDTAGSRFLLFLADQPQLDGKLTVFGEVVGGWEVLDSIEQGERIEAVREVP